MIILSEAKNEPIEILGSPAAASSLGGSFIRFEKSS